MLGSSPLSFGSIQVLRIILLILAIVDDQSCESSSRRPPDLCQPLHRKSRTDLASIVKK